MQTSRDDWVRISGASWQTMPMVLLLLPRGVERQLLTLDASDEDMPVVLQCLVETAMQDQYPGTQLVGVYRLPDRGCWGLQCVHHRFPRTRHGEVLPMWALVGTWEGPDTYTLSLDETGI